jgi:3-methyladenine DNA glycosylase AlkD
MLLVGIVFVRIRAMSKALDDFKEELYGAGYDPALFKTSRMVGTDLKTAGLTIPRVKKVVENHRKDSRLDLEEFPLDETVELTLCYFLLSLRKQATFEKQMAFLQGKLRYANSWMITDSLPQVIGKAPLSSFLSYFKAFSHSRFVYERRFAYVFAMRYYKEKDIALFLEGIQPDESYYVMMAEAWLIATLGITHFAEVVSYLQKDEVPLALKRKAISKMRDSFRISEKEKEILKKIRDNL